MLLLLRVKRVAPADQRELAGRVRTGAGPRDSPGGAGDVDDRRAFSLRRGIPQQWQHRLGQLEWSLEVQLHVLLDVRPPRIGERPTPGRARVVHEKVKRAVLLLDLLADCLWGARIREIERDHGRATELVGERPQSVFSPSD